MVSGGSERKGENVKLRMSDSHRLRHRHRHRYIINEL